MGHMSTEQTWQTESTSLKATLLLAGQIGRKLRGGEVIELVSDLGGGKTAFVRGLVKGRGGLAAVRSPSFTLSNQYEADGLTIHHFDFYRLSQPGIISQALAEVLTDPKSVVAVEWPGIVQDVLPKERLTIKITATGKNSRRFMFKYPKFLSYLVTNNT